LIKTEALQKDTSKLKQHVINFKYYSTEFILKFKIDFSNTKEEYRNFRLNEWLKSREWEYREINNKSHLIRLEKDNGKRYMPCFSKKPSYNYKKHKSLFFYDGIDDHFHRFFVDVYFVTNNPKQLYLLVIDVGNNHFDIRAYDVDKKIVKILLDESSSVESNIETLQKIVNDCGGEPKS
jgi:hypothetical protein